MTSANGPVRHRHTRWKLLPCVLFIAAALSGCGVARDVAQQAGIPDSVFQALGLSGPDAKPVAQQAAAPVKPAARHRTRHARGKSRHAKHRAADQAPPQATALPAPAAPDTMKTIEAQTDGAAATIAVAQVTVPPEADPHPKGEEPAAPAIAAPRHVSRKQIEDKVYLAIQQCKQLHQEGGLSSYKETAECMGPRIWAAWREANYPYMDLIGLYVSALEKGADQLDRHAITEAEFEGQMTRLQARIASEEQQRNRPAAQLTAVNGTAGLSSANGD